MSDAIEAAWQAATAEATKAERELSLQAFREIFEVWAGSDGIIPETAPEAYQQTLIEEMAKIAGESIQRIQQNEYRVEAT